MKALTVHQPWAWAIINGRKRVENRNWSTRVRGRIAIHSSQTRTRRWRELTAMLEDAATWKACNESPNGAILGTVELVDCVEEMTCSPSQGWLCRLASSASFPPPMQPKLRGLLPRWVCLPLNTPAFAGRTFQHECGRYPNEGRSVSSGDTSGKRRSRSTSGTLNEGRSVSSGDTSTTRRPARILIDAQRRPER